MSFKQPKDIDQQPIPALPKSQTVIYNRTISGSSQQTAAITDAGWYWLTTTVAICVLEGADPTAEATTGALYPAGFDGLILVRAAGNKLAMIAVDGTSTGFARLQAAL